jgi:hypothetical protein
VELITCFYLVPRLRMHEAVLPLPTTTNDVLVSCFYMYVTVHARGCGHVHTCMLA